MNTGSAWVRQLIERVLRTDADLVAFCIDWIPAAARRFSDGMDRVEKTNLIFRLEEPGIVLERLRRHDPKGTDEAELTLRQWADANAAKGGLAPGYRIARPRRKWGDKNGLHRPILTIDLRGNGASPRYYLHPDDDLSVRPELIPMAETPCPLVFEPRFKFAERHGIEALNAVLDLGQEHLLEQCLSGRSALDAGAALFDVLFPTESHWQGVMRRVRGLSLDAPEEVMPTQESLRLRVCTSIPMLQSLPWRLLAWEGYFLSDHNWTMEVVPVVQAATRVKLTVPCKLLIVAPQYQGMVDIGTDRHVAALKAALCERLPSWNSPLLWREVQTRKQLAGALSGMQPDILYYFGHGSLAAGGLPSIEMGAAGDAADHLLLPDLLRLLKDHPPQVVWINGCMTGVQGFHGASQQLVHAVPIVLSQRTSAYSGHAAPLALRFFQRFLLDGKDPALALHHLDDVYSRTDFQWSTTLFHASYTSCEVQTHQPAGPTEDAAKRLDRREPKALVDDFLVALKRSATCLVHALLVCGAQGADVDHFSWQCTDHLVRNKERRILRFCLSELPPADSSAFSVHLDLLLRRALDADETEAIEHALRKQLRQPIDAIWIDFGTLRPTPEEEIPLKKWLGYCCDVLSRHCPPNGRIIATLGIELSSDELHDTAKDITSTMRAFSEALRQRGAHQSFRCDFLQPNAMVTEDDLHHFFDDADNTSCLLRFRQDAARLIFQRSAGLYAEAVKLIELGEREKWAESYFAMLDPDQRGTESDRKKRRIT